VALRRNARIIDEIDVTVGFAELAAEMNFVRPVVNDRLVPLHFIVSLTYLGFRSLNFLTVNGRHPAVELGLLTTGRVFTPNTVDLGPDSRLMFITGPNMVSQPIFRTRWPDTHPCSAGRQIYRAAPMRPHRDSSPNGVVCTRR
jgi:hypothetical protein